MGEFGLRAITYPLAAVSMTWLGTYMTGLQAFVVFMGACGLLWIVAAIIHKIRFGTWN